MGSRTLHLYLTGEPLATPAALATLTALAALAAATSAAAAWGPLAMPRIVGTTCAAGPALAAPAAPYRSEISSRLARGFEVSGHWSRRLSSAGLSSHWRPKPQGGRCAIAPGPK